jgi:hypothetical protein
VKGLELVVQIVKTETGTVQLGCLDSFIKKLHESARIKLIKDAQVKRTSNPTHTLEQLLDENFRKYLTRGSTAVGASISQQNKSAMLCA